MSRWIFVSLCLITCAKEWKFSYTVVSEFQFANKCSFHSFGSCFNNSSSQLCESVLEMENALIAGILGSRLRRRRLLNLVQLLHRRRAVLLKVGLLSFLLLLSSDENETRVRSCRRDTTGAAERGGLGGLQPPPNILRTNF